MKTIKRIFLRVFFVLELIVFGFVYACGPHGFYALQELEQQNNQLQTDAAMLKQEVQMLERKIAQWHAHPFYKEKIAREQLQMARKGDKIYYVS